MKTLKENSKNSFDPKMTFKEIKYYLFFKDINGIHWEVFKKHNVYHAVTMNTTTSNINYLKEGDLAALQSQMEEISKESCYETAATSI